MAFWVVHALAARGGAGPAALRSVVRSGAGGGWRRTRYRQILRGLIRTGVVGRSGRRWQGLWSDWLSGGQNGAALLGGREVLGDGQVQG